MPDAIARGSPREVYHEVARQSSGGLDPQQVNSSGAITRPQTPRCPDASSIPWYAPWSVSEPLPDCIARLLWQVDPGHIDLDAHRDYVLERVMQRGGWNAMRWLRRTYSLETIADFLRRRGTRLPPRERAYWSLAAGVEIEQEPGGGRPSWAAP